MIGECSKCGLRTIARGEEPPFHEPGGGSRTGIMRDRTPAPRQWQAGRHAPSALRDNPMRVRIDGADNVGAVRRTRANVQHVPTGDIDHVETSGSRCCICIDCRNGEHRNRHNERSQNCRHTAHRILIPIAQQWRRRALRSSGMQARRVQNVPAAARLRCIHCMIGIWARIAPIHTSNAPQAWVCTICPPPATAITIT